MVSMVTTHEGPGHYSAVNATGEGEYRWLSRVGAWRTILSVPLGRVLSLLLVAAIGVLPVAPPEHVHDVETDGHHAVVAHRHAANHHRHSPPHDDHDDHDGRQVHPDDGPDVDHRASATLDDEDSVVALVTPVWTLPSVDPPDAPATAQVGWILPPPACTHAGHVGDVERLIHGPPCPHASLRGPPSSSRL